MKLCPTCQQKPTPPGTYRGQCLPKVSQNCKAWTDDYALTICDPCAEEMGRCAWCWGPLNGSWGAPVVPTEKQFVRAFDRDNGIHIEGMDVGEQVLVQLVVDVYSGRTWRVKRTSREIRFHGYRTVRDPHNWRLATLELYFDLNDATEKGEIVLEDAPDQSRWWWWGPPPSTGKQKEWRCTVEVRR